MPVLRVRRIAYALGAQVTGIDIRDDLDDEVIAEIRQAWLAHQVLCFPNQPITQEQLLAFATRFGELERVVKERAVAGTPHVTLLAEKTVGGKPWNGYKGGQNWHSDKSFTTKPTEATFLTCKEIPPIGGDTMFANTYLGYESLSPAMQRLIEGLSAIHDFELRLKFQSAQVGDRDRIAQAVQGEEKAFAPTVHPAVRVHRETKRKAIYLGDRVQRFVGLSEEESRPLLEFLGRHATRHEFTYRHRWNVDDLIMWDNRCTYHIALCDYRVGQDVRCMMRCAVAGPSEGHELSESEERRDLAAISG